MEKKYPVLKCNEELWNEIKPVLESFGITDFNVVPDWNNNYLISNYGYVDKNEIFIGNDKNPKINYKSSLRYLVNTKEEFLSAIAKFLGKEYPIKEQSSETKYPCIKCTQQLYDKIKDILINIGYKEVSIDVFDDDEYLIINYQNKLGQLTNLCPENIKNNNRYECSSIKGFLIKACELKCFEVVYNTFVKDNDAENHYFKYVINKENKTIEISETYNNEGECSANVTFKKRFKKKKERYVAFYDPGVRESSTVVATIPAKGNDFDKDMEKINIVNKLKHCKKGTKLYSPIFGEVEFDNIENNAIYVNTINNDNKIVSIPFESNGQFYSCYSNGECLLFPSKDNRNWNNFRVLEEGHRVMCSDNANNWSLRLYVADNKAICFNPAHDANATCWQYIVPVEDFDFTTEDITINKEKSIV